MRFTTAAIVATAAGLASAAPACSADNSANTASSSSSSIADGDVFRVMSIRSGSEIQYASLQAKSSGLYLKAPSQGASCSEEVDYASFKISNGSLYLNTANPPQEIWVDRSGMGQGLIGYTTGAQQPSRNAERQGFTITDDGNLVFRDQTKQDIGFTACPGATGGGYSVWLDIVENPGFNQNCTSFTARAQKEDKPVSCSYTS